MQKTNETVTFFITHDIYENKEKNQKFPIFEAFIGPKQRRITLKFRRDVKNIPTEDGYLTVNRKDMSIDKRYRYPALWVHSIVDFKPTNEFESENDTVNALFNEGDLPF